jgi:hypothetical protein
MTAVVSLGDSDAARTAGSAPHARQGAVGAPDRREDEGGVDLVSAPSTANGHRPEPDAGQDVGGSSAASGSWPDWAREQLTAALDTVDEHDHRSSGRWSAELLYRRWYYPASEAADATSTRPLAGVMRSAHAGGIAPVMVDGVSVVHRNDVVGPDGWWRTWGEGWTTAHARSRTYRLQFSPRLDSLGDFVCTMTAALLDTSVPWLLACATDLRRARRAGSAVLTVRDLADVPEGLLDRVAPILRSTAPALCQPIAPGIALTEQAGSVHRFAEYRCHLVATALRRPLGPDHPLGVVARTFAAHDIDPAAPWRAAD